MPCAITLPRHHDRHRSFRRAQSGWRGVGFGMSKAHEADNAELAAIAYGLLLLQRRGESGRNYTVFTNSTAAMTRAVNDTRGPGQEIALRRISLAFLRRRAAEQATSE